MKIVSFRPVHEGNRIIDGFVNFRRKIDSKWGRNGFHFGFFLPIPIKQEFKDFDSFTVRIAWRMPYIGFSWRRIRGNGRLSFRFIGFMSEW